MANKKFSVGWIILIILVAVFVVIQFFGIDRSIPKAEPSQDFMAVANPPQEIKALVYNACYDCHSYETKYPWYANVQPVGWFLRGHIKEAREHINFSLWETYSPEAQKGRLEHASEEIKSGGMPLWSYRLEHPNARLTDQEKATLTSWLSNYNTSLSK